VPGAAIRRVRTLSLPAAGAATDGAGAAASNARAFLQQLEDDASGGHALFGWLGYEVGAALGQLPRGLPRDARLPDACFVVFDPRDVEPIDGGAASRSAPDAALPGTTPPHAAQPAAAPQSDLQRHEAAFVDAVRAALAAIAAGDLYQVNVTVRATFAASAALQGASAAAGLAAIGAAQPVPWAGALVGPEVGLWSGSMECFLSRDGDRVRSRPIKGTRPRGDTRAGDLQQRAALLASAKERAENTMIVDMVRNDLGRVATPDGVRPSALLEAVPYATLWHLESELEATLRPGVTFADIVSATFPPASVTGCPGRAAVRAIAGLERRHRGPYCGALGLILPGGDFELSVGIRQLLRVGDEASVSVGAGIVADSDPAAEWHETRLKARSGLRLAEQLSSDAYPSSAASLASAVSPSSAASLSSAVSPSSAVSGERP
jgi:anthranilate/para-aminobenzoate synthase component I